MPAAKQTILRLLEQSRGVSLSGEQIAQELNISRAAVWKAVNQLKKEGYRIEAVQNRGYRLDPDSDLLSAEGIRSTSRSFWNRASPRPIRPPKNWPSRALPMAPPSLPAGRPRAAGGWGVRFSLPSAPGFI